MTLSLLFIVDPLASLKPAKDSSIALMREAARRGHAIHVCGRHSLVWEHGAVSAEASPLTLTGADAPWYRTEASVRQPLNHYSAVLMRQDPPFDFEYIAATWLLERAEAQGARVFNRPAAIRDHSEKLSILEFPEHAPVTLVARDAAALNGFIDAEGDVILKPLDGMGGSRIFRVRRDDPNRQVIIETLTDHGRETIMAQRRLPEIVDGDKRVLLIGGEVMPFSLARIPLDGETRGNLAAGGRGVAMPLTADERSVAEALAPRLWARGLLIVGLDLIGGRLTEINVTSPTCMVEIAAQTGFSVAGCVIDRLEDICDTAT